jgi:hypothetical protein
MSGHCGTATAAALAFGDDADAVSLRRAAGIAAILRRPMVKVGGEVDALCSKCEMVLAHTVHAVVDGSPVKVECNTCHGVHRFRPPAGQPSARARAGVRKDRPAREKPPVVAFEDLLAGKDVTAAKPYSPKHTFAVDEVVDHPTFGRGFVSAVRDARKVEITFRSDVKILVHGRG